MSEGYIDISHNVVGLMLQCEAEIAKAKCNNTAYLQQQSQMSLFVLKEHICQVDALLSMAVSCLVKTPEFFYSISLKIKNMLFETKKALYFTFYCCYPLFSHHIIVVCYDCLQTSAMLYRSCTPSPALSLCYLFQNTVACKLVCSRLPFSNHIFFRV